MCAQTLFDGRANPLEALLADFDASGGGGATKLTDFFTSAAGAGHAAVAGRYSSMTSLAAVLYKMRRAAAGTLLPPNKAAGAARARRFRARRAAKAAAAGARAGGRSSFSVEEQLFIMGEAPTYAVEVADKRAMVISWVALTEAMTRRFNQTAGYYPVERVSDYFTNNSK